MVTRRNIDLDIVRGAAVACVLVYHLGDIAGATWLGILLAPIQRMGWAGVELFFVLSGFLIGRAIIAEVDATSGFRLGRFLVRRAFRLWPALYVYLFALVAMGGVASLPTVIPVAFHVQNYVDGTPQHLWSLAVEEHFYLGAGLLLPWLLVRERGALLAALTVGVVMVMPMALRLSLPASISDVYATPYRLDALACGVGLALLVAARPTLVARITRHRAGLLVAAITGFAGVSWLSGDGVKLALGIVVADWAAMALVLCALGAPVRERPGRMGRVFAWLGLRSYSTYIWHIAAGQLAIAAVGADAALASLLAITLAIAAGHASYAVVEMPFLRLRDRMMPGAAGRYLSARGRVRRAACATTLVLRHRGLSG